MPAAFVLAQLDTVITIFYDCLAEGEEERVREWIEAHPEYGPIIERALLIAQQERVV